MPRKRKTSADCDIIREYQRNWLRDKLKNDPEYKARHYANRQNRAKQNKENLTNLKKNICFSACGEYHPACSQAYHQLYAKKKEKLVILERIQKFAQLEYLAQSLMLSQLIYFYFFEKIIVSLCD